MHKILAAALCAASFAFGSAEAATFETKLYLSSDGVALSSLPERHVLKRTIEVGRTLGHAPVTWSAVSDQPWLSVTAGGVTGDKLKVSADPTGLAPDQTHIAKVTVSTSTAEFADSETLTVGLWVGASKARRQVMIEKTVTFVATNPVLPFAYVGVGRDIHEYNVYTAKQTRIFRHISETVGPMTVSSDGRTLFEADQENRKFAAIDLETGSIAARFPAPTSDWTHDLVYARPFGQPALYTGSGVVAYPSGEVLTGPFASGYLAVSPDGRKAVTMDTNSTTPLITSYTLSLDRGALALTPVAEMLSNAGGFDMVMSRDGRYFYSADGWDGVGVYDSKSLALVRHFPMVDGATNVELDPFGRIFAGSPFASFDDYDYDVFSFDRDGNMLGKVKSIFNAGQGDTKMKLSGDGTRVVSTTEFPQNHLTFRNAP